MPNDREQRIQQRAYEIWEREGRPEGRDQDHWSRAEQELGRDMQSEDAGADDAAGPELGLSAEPLEQVQSQDEAAPQPAVRKTTRKRKS